MIPYSEKYYTRKVEEYNEVIKEKHCGDFYIKKAKKSKFDGYLYDFEESCSLEVVELWCKDKLWMRISPHEVQGCFESIKNAKGKVGVMGLGLGYFTQEVLRKPEVTEVVVYEISSEVIELYKNNFGTNEKLRIENVDGFKAESENFDFFFVDIYGYKFTEEVVDHYIKLTELHNIEEYSFWGVEQFLLSCKLEHIMMVYIPELWMCMTKDLFSRISETKYLDYFSKLPEALVKVTLDRFAEVL